MALTDVNKAVLGSLTAFLEQIVPNDYSQPLQVFNGSSLGEHTRHIIEFYQCLITQSTNGIVCYDLRERKRELQESPVAAMRALQQIVADLDGLHLPSTVTLEVNPHTVGGQVQQVPTTIERELLYVLDHSIHHMALIKIGVGMTLPQLRLAPDFGVAPSTIRSRMAVAG